MRSTFHIISIRAACLLALMALLAIGLSEYTEAVYAQRRKKPSADEGPSIRLAIPLGVSPGTITKVTVRGTGLDTATAVRFPNSKATGKILSKGKAPMGKGDNAGPTEVIVEITIPAEMAGTEVSFNIVTPKGETKSHALLLAPKSETVAENEPNNGFREAQVIHLPAAIDGAIGAPQDVDVFRFEGKAGQKVRFEVFAARHGSALDSVLTLYDATGNELASADDQVDSRDSRLEATLPKSGTYYISLIDAHDLGGETYPYRLRGQVIPRAQRGNLRFARSRHRHRHPRATRDLFGLSETG